jgi:hypothetical protein
MTRWILHHEVFWCVVKMYNLSIVMWATTTKFRFSNERISLFDSQKKLVQESYEWHMFLLWLLNFWSLLLSGCIDRFFLSMICIIIHTDASLIQLPTRWYKLKYHVTGLRISHWPQKPFLLICWTSGAK